MFPGMTKKPTPDRELTGVRHERMLGRIMKRHSLSLSLGLVLIMALWVPAEDRPAEPPAAKTAASPQAADNAPGPQNLLAGGDLAAHDFLYAGEAKDRKIFIIRKGRVVWSYDDPEGRGEISDAVLLSTGNVLLAHQFAVKLVGPDKKVIWNFDAPKGCEIHTAQPIGKDHVLFVQNGEAPVLKVVNIATGETKTQFPLPVRNSKSVHGQFRHARLTAEGTVAVAHMDLGKIAVYDATGKELWSIAADSPWGVTPLKSGNLLIVDRAGVREVNKEHESVWTCSRADLADYHFSNLQLAWRLPNGNTLINNWVSQWQGPVDKSAAPVQALELTAEKKLVWALRSWSDPDLGPATTLQILDTPEAPEDVRFGEIK
jgi:outer membrane protein assembly factor BamB